MWHARLYEILLLSPIYFHCSSFFCVLLNDLMKQNETTTENWGIHWVSKCLCENSIRAFILWNSIKWIRFLVDNTFYLLSFIKINVNYNVNYTVILVGSIRDCFSSSSFILVEMILSRVSYDSMMNEVNHHITFFYFRLLTEVVDPPETYRFNIKSRERER